MCLLPRKEGERVTRDELIDRSKKKKRARSWNGEVPGKTTRTYIEGDYGPCEFLDLASTPWSMLSYVHESALRVLRRLSSFEKADGCFESSSSTVGTRAYDWQCVSVPLRVNSVFYY